MKRPKNQLKKALLSGFLVFHLLGVWLTPNDESLLTRRLVPIYAPYMNFLGLEGEWSFFVPDPNLDDVQIRYEIQTPGRPLEAGEFLKKPDDYRFRDAYLRLISLGTHMARASMKAPSPFTIQQLFATYLCKKNPQSEKVRIWTENTSHPKLLAENEADQRLLPEKDVFVRQLGWFGCRGEAHAQPLQ